MNIKLSLDKKNLDLQVPGISMKAKIKHVERVNSS